MSERRDALERARVLLREVNAQDPGFADTPPFSLNERQGRRERLIARHYIAYGARHVLFELFPELDPDEPGDGGSRE